MKWLALVGLIGCSSSNDVVGPFTGPVHRFVVDRFSLPVTYSDAHAIADDLDGDGIVDNVLGSALGELSRDQNLTTHSDDMIKSGAIASIVEIQADDLQNDPTVGVRYFGRSDGVERDPTIVIGGSIVDGTFLSNRTRSTEVPGRATLRLPVFADADPSVIVLDAMEIDLDPDEAGSYHARIRGGVGLEVRQEAGRGLMQMIEANPSGHQYAQLLFDTNKDGYVTSDEIGNSGLIKSFLPADVRVLVDDEYVDRVSFGFGVHLMPCANGNCALGTPTATCFDRIVDGDETDIDCGGSCRPCAAMASCRVAADCQSQSCSGVCAGPSCTDGVKDGNESDVDCGWNCAGCARFAMCNRDPDCASGRCGSDGVCF